MNEHTETIQTVAKHFKMNNPAWSKVKCYVTDKDVTAIPVLGDEFPGARALLRQWHMIEYVGQVLSSGRRIVPLYLDHRRLA